MAQQESVLLIPAVDMTELIEQLRTPDHSGDGPGMPPHITIMYPFFGPARLTTRVLENLDSLLGATRAFEYALTEIREFDRGVLYLAAEPAHLFVELTELVSKRFAVLPFGGAFRTVVPHLTLTTQRSGSDRRRIAKTVNRFLPQRCRASEVWLMVGSNETGWKTMHIIRFR